MATDPVSLAWISLAGTTVTGLLVLANTMISNSHTRALEKMRAAVADTKAAVADTKATIATLEKNTNSIKDALVQVTGESEFAKGLKMGQATSGGHVSEQVLDAQTKAAHSMGVLKGTADEKNRIAAEEANKGKPEEST